MPVESWISPEETLALAVDATAQIDAALARLTDEERAAFWASVRKCYNTPYNAPAPRRLSARPIDIEPATGGGLPIDLPAAALAAISGPAGVMAEIHAP